MPVNINRLKEAIAGWDFQRPNLYFVQFTPPSSILSSFSGERSRNLSLLCNTVTWPGKSYGTFENRTYGPLRKFPYDKIYTEVSMAFYQDTPQNAQTFFNLWFDIVMIGDKGSWEYYDNYIGEIDISLLDRQGYVTNQIKLLEAYPSAISDQPLGYENTDQVMNFEITFTFRRWIETDPNPIRVNL